MAQFVLGDAIEEITEEDGIEVSFAQARADPRKIAGDTTVFEGEGVVVCAGFVLSVEEGFPGYSMTASSPRRRRRPSM